MPITGEVRERNIQGKLQVKDPKRLKLVVLKKQKGGQHGWSTVKDDATGD